MDCAAVWAACVSQTRAFVHGAGFAHAVIGLSGGIDSSLVAAVAVEALGAAQVHGVLLPGPYSSDHSVRDAEELARALDVECATVSINGPYEAFCRALEPALGEPLSGLAAQNTQARCRMACLMALSNARGWLMLNTGNKSEAAMGYSTLYGDTAGAFAPIGGLYKTQVYELARWANAQAGAAGRAAPIPQNVIEKPPSAELAPGQSDEASLGIDYDTLDRILARHLECGDDADALVRCGFDPAQVRMVLARYAASAFKRAAEPPFARIDAGGCA